MLYVTTVFAFALPIGAMIWWKRRADLSIAPFAVGAMCFLLFSMGLEQMLHSLVLGGDTALSVTVRETPWLYVLYGCLAAGIFEESGRLFGYKLLLREQHAKEVSVGYGIGHGGMESMLTLGVTYLMLSLISLGVSLGDANADAMMKETVHLLTGGTMALAMLERITAMMLHIGLSILVFAAANRSGRMAFFPLTILLHALADVPVAMYQVGILQSVPLVEGTALICGIAVLGLGLRVYQRMDR